MIDIQELEKTTDFHNAMPRKGIYGVRVPEIIKEFGRQQFAKIHIAAVLLKELDIDFTDVDVMDNHNRAVSHWLRHMEREGLIEKTGKKTLNQNSLYRRVL